LRRVSLDEKLVAELRQDPNSANLSDEDRAIVNFVIRLTKYPSSMIEDDVKQLRKFGFDDRAVLQITMIASWFNYVNRVADALGLGKV
jgi:uncharacterized peroxidase-related enzyme